MSADNCLHDIVLGLRWDVFQLQMLNSEPRKINDANWQLPVTSIGNFITPGIAFSKENAKICPSSWSLFNIMRKNSCLQLKVTYHRSIWATLPVFVSLILCNHNPSRIQTPVPVNYSILQSFPLESLNFWPQTLLTPTLNIFPIFYILRSIFCIVSTPEHFWIVYIFPL